ncbi:MAG: hypothetical protein OXJ62_14155 [Spirochaetaceae bacterium]|nr:hypothetical protein [Spirochaetaceae bacterium]
MSWPTWQHRPLTRRQRLGVVVGLGDGAPVELARVVVEQLRAGRSSTVSVENAGAVPIILEQRRRKPRTVLPGFGSGVLDLRTATLRAEQPGAVVRVRVVAR